MDQEEFEAKIKDSTKVVESARKAQRDTFVELSRYCKYRYESSNGNTTVCNRRLQLNYSHYEVCDVVNCPFVIAVVRPREDLREFPDVQ